MLKTLAVTLMIVGIAMSTSAQAPAYSEPVMLPSLQESALLLLARATSHISSSGVRTMVATEATATVFIFPIVGSVQGQNGTYFRSDTTLVNRLQRSQNIEAFYFPAGAGCSGLMLQSFTLNANTWYDWPDVVSQLFKTSGLGSVIVFATDSNQNSDSSARIDGFTRIWTPIPGSSGTASQAFSPVPLSFAPGGELLNGLRQDSGFRTNVGIFNYLPTDLSGGTRTFDIYISGATDSAQSSIAVSPCSMVQQAIPSGSYGALGLSIVPRDTKGGWYGFASSIDNVSGDSWSSTARP